MVVIAVIMLLHVTWRSTPTNLIFSSVSHRFRELLKLSTYLRIISLVFITEPVVLAYKECVKCNQTRLFIGSAVSCSHQYISVAASWIVV